MEIVFVVVFRTLAVAFVAACFAVGFSWKLLRRSFTRARLRFLSYQAGRIRGPKEPG